LVERHRQTLQQAQIVATDGQPRILEGYRRDLERAEQRLKQIVDALKPAIEVQLRLELSQKSMAELDSVTMESTTLRAQHDRLEQDVTKLAVEANQIGRASVELEMMRVELDNLESFRKQISAEVEGLQIEVNSPARAIVLSKAEPSQFFDTKPRT